MRASESLRVAAVELLARRAPLEFTIVGRSMEPLLRDGRRLAVRARVPAYGEIALFREEERWVAHRVVAFDGETLICAGDAQPESLERIARERVAGTVDAGALDRALGPLIALTRRTRALWRLASPFARERSYANLLAVLEAIVCDDADALRHRISQGTPWKLAAVARRHRVDALLGARLANHAEGSPHARALVRSFHASRYRAAIAAIRYERDVRALVAALGEAGIVPLLLKGAARAIGGEPDAAVFSAQDIDVLVPGDRVERAREALIAHGYAPLAQRFDFTHHRHIVPLAAPGRYPVEIHRRIGDAGRVPVSYDELLTYATPVLDGAALVLDRVGTAVHHVVHAQVRPEARELFMLARLLRIMNASERGALVRLLSRSGERLIACGAVLALAARLARLPAARSRRIERAAAWARLREDLPRPMRAYPEVIDAFVNARRDRVRNALRAGFTGRVSRRPVARALGRYVCALLALGYAALMPRRGEARGR